MIRILKLIIGLPLILAGAVLALVAVVGFIADASAAGRAVAFVMAVFSLLLLIVGFRLVKRTRAKNEGVASLMYSGTSNAVDGFQYITVASNGRISVNANSAAEANAAIKELRILKKSFALQKRAVLDRQKAIRAKYTDQVRRRGSKFRGGGGFGRFIRNMQTISRDSSRSELARQLEPLENEKQRLEHAIAQVDSLITQVQSHLLRMS